MRLDRNRTLRRLGGEPRIRGDGRRLVLSAVKVQRRISKRDQVERRNTAGGGSMILSEHQCPIIIIIIIMTEVS
jgi:hypothetical protein